MTAALTEICPLCREAYPPGKLLAHLASERNAVQQQTIRMIRKRHPDWIETDGACPRCWKVYAGLDRLVHFFSARTSARTNPVEAAIP